MVRFTLPILIEYIVLYCLYCLHIINLSSINILIIVQHKSFDFYFSQCFILILKATFTFHTLQPQLLGKDSLILHTSLYEPSREKTNILASA